MSHAETPTETLCAECGMSAKHPFHRNPAYVNAHTFVAGMFAAPLSTSQTPSPIESAAVNWPPIRTSATSQSPPAEPTPPSSTGETPYSPQYVEDQQECYGCDGTGMFTDDTGTWHCGQCNGQGWRYRVYISNPRPLSEMLAEIQAMGPFVCPACDDEVDEEAGPCAVCHNSERARWLEQRDSELLSLRSQLSSALTRVERAEADSKDLDALCLNLASAWFYGSWKAETTNESALQSLMERRGWWPIDEDTLVARRASRSDPAPSPDAPLSSETTNATATDEG